MNGDTFSELTDADYALVQNTLGLESSFGNIIAEPLTGNNDLLDQSIMNMVNAEETTLSIEEYEYMHENGYLPQPVFPPSEPTELCNTDYAGPYNFEVFVDPNVMKNPWEYSPLLNKIYIDMKHKFPINFSVKNQAPEGGLFVRVMPMFEEDRHFQELVHRCICHGQLQDPTNQGVPEQVTQHIIRCDNNNAQYFGNKNQGKRLNIVIPLSSPQAGTDSVKEFFYFVCKNSCVGGMNRRPIQVVFTLEDEGGSVLGRRVLCVRICSCPKRDREKEEKKQEKPAGHSGKKRKMEKKATKTEAQGTSDTRLFAINITIAGEENYKRVLKTVQSLMADEIVNADAKNGSSAVFTKCRNAAVDLLELVSDLSD